MFFALGCMGLMLRVNYSEKVIHVTYFRTRLLKWAEDDPYWFGVYKNLPPQKKHIRMSVFKDMHSFMSLEAQKKYRIRRLEELPTVKRKSKNDVEIPIYD
jgi:hypothetical protein